MPRTNHGPAIIAPMRSTHSRASNPGISSLVFALFAPETLAVNLECPVHEQVLPNSPQMWKTTLDSEDTPATHTGTSKNRTQRQHPVCFVGLPQMAINGQTQPNRGLNQIRRALPCPGTGIGTGRTMDVHVHRFSFLRTDLEVDGTTPK
jgi:hypothetical protein